MSSKLGTKSMKRASGSSSSKKKTSSGTTPDSIITPNASGASIGIEKPQENTIDDVLVGDDVLALRIREEDLIKAHIPKPPSSSPHKRKVVVRRYQSPARERLCHKEKEVAVLHPLPPGATVTATKTIGSVERHPKFDQRRTFLSRSVFGPARDVDYARELKNQQVVGSTSAFVNPPPLKVKKQSHLSFEKTILPREEHSLKFWDESMKQRHIQQRHISNKVRSVPEKLLMNQGDAFRSIQEERMVIDRTMPSVNYGKGNRVGSEFWSQHVQVGSQETGIHTTLTRTEQGSPPELEFVGVSAVVAKERGSVKELERNLPCYYTWDQAPYLSTRREELFGPLMDLHRPVVSGMAVEGRASGFDSVTQKTDSLDSLGESSGSDCEEALGSILDLHADFTRQLIIGPALLVNGQLLQWDGPPLPTVKDEPLKGYSRSVQSDSALERVKPQYSTISFRDMDRSFHTIPIDFRVNFESNTGVMVTSNVELENYGSAAVYYSWQLFPKRNPLGTIQAGDTQRFYFDTRGGVLLPGQKFTFPFIFKSPNPGMFSETWLLQTGPVLCQGRQVVFTLKGVAFQDDLNKQKREKLEGELKHRVAVLAAEILINRIVDSIRTPPYSLEPVPTSETEEYVFKVQNPDYIPYNLTESLQFYYHHGVVTQLKTLYNSIQQPEHVTEQPIDEPSTRLEKNGSGKKDDKSGGIKSKEKAVGKEKKGSKFKDDSIREETLTPSQETPYPEIPDWDLSISSLREVILSVEEVAVVEGKLKELSTLVGYITFPPPKQFKRNSYNVVYETLCEAVDQICDVSNTLCQSMGLPFREFCQKDESGIGDKLGESNVAVPSRPVSPAHPKDKKVKDSKKGKLTKDSVRTGSSKNKIIPPRKSKSSFGNKDSDTSKQATSEITISVDPVTKQKYTNNLHSSVYKMLGAVIDRIDMLLSQN